MVEVCAL